jgi:hypothetical protein
MKSDVEKAVEKQVWEEIDDRLGRLRCSVAWDVETVYRLFPELDPGNPDDQVVARDLFHQIADNPTFLIRKRFRKNYPLLFGAVVLSIVQRLKIESELSL